MEGEKIFIADKLTVDNIYALLLSSEFGLNVLKGILLESAGTAETTVGSLDAIGDALANDTSGLGAIKAAVEGKADAEDVTAIKSLLENGTSGLGAIKTAISGRANESTSTAIKSLLENTTYGLNAIKSAVNGRANESTSTAIKSLLENGTYGLNAIKTAINGRANESTSTAIKSLLENGTYGLNALKNALNSPRVVKSVQRGTASHNGVANGGTAQQRTVTVNISSVNTAKSLAVVYAAGASSIAMHLSCAAKTLTATSLAIQLNYMDSYNKEIMVGWQVIEFY
jgi:translation elongation factor EF-1beta